MSHEIFAPVEKILSRLGYPLDGPVFPSRGSSLGILEIQSKVRSCAKMPFGFTVSWCHDSQHRLARKNCLSRRGIPRDWRSHDRNAGPGGRRGHFHSSGPLPFLGDIDKLVARIREDGGQATAFLQDACDAAGTTSLVERVIHQYGKIDVLVCNVGQNQARPAEAVTHEEWRRFTDINLISAFNA